MCLFKKKFELWNIKLIKQSPENIQGLVAQGRTISETIEIAKDIAKKLIEAQKDEIPKLQVFNDSFDYPMVIGI